MDLAFEWISTYGYVAIVGLLLLGIVGLPVPDEALLTFVGYLSFKGDLHVGAALLSAVLGTTGGITISYGLGRFIGLRLLIRVTSFLHLHPDGVQHAQIWIQRWGPYALPLAYFVPGARHVAALLTGASGLPLSTFARFAYSGALLWCGTFIAIGYGFGAEWSRLSPVMQRTIVIVVLLACTGTAVLLLALRRRKQPTS